MDKTKVFFKYQNEIYVQMYAETFYYNIFQRSLNVSNRLEMKKFLLIEH